MRSYPETLLDADLPHGRAPADRVRPTSAQVPWGISESAYNVVDRHGTYQYKAFGVPGLGLEARPRRRAGRRALRDGARRDGRPAAAARNLRRLAAEGLGGRLRLLRRHRLHARDDRRARLRREPRRPQRDRRARLPGPPPGHDARRARQRAARRRRWSSASTPIRACRPPSCCCRSACPATRRSRSRARSRRRAVPGRRRRARPPLPLAAHAVPARAVPVERQLHHRRHQRRRRRQLLARPRRDARPRGRHARPGQPVHLPARRAQRRRLVGDAPARRAASPTSTSSRSSPRRRRFQPPRRRASRRSSTSPSPRRTTSRCGGSRSPTTATGRARSRSPATPRSCSRPPADDLAHPAFGKLFVETEYLPERHALLCRRRPRAADEPALWAVHVLSLEGRPQGPVEWETDRARFLGRGRDRRRSARARRTLAVRHDRRRARPDREPAPAHPAGAGRLVRLSFATGVAPSRETALALAQKYHDPSAAARSVRARLRARAERPARTWASPATTRCSSSGWPRACSTPTARCARPPELVAQNELGQAGLWPHGISGDLPILLVRVVEEDDLPLVRAGAAGPGVLAAQGPARRRRDPQRAPGELPRRDARPAHGAPRRRALAGVEAQARRRLSCCAATAWATPSACCSRRWRAPC